MEPSVDHVGPMASNVTDVAKLLEVIAGYDGGRDHRQNPHVTIPKYSQLVSFHTATCSNITCSAAMHCGNNRIHCNALWE